MRRKSSVTIIFFTVFLDLLGFGIVLPLMPLYALDPRFAASPAQIGWLMAIYSIMQFFFAPLWGRYSDRVGRRPVLIIGLFGSSISYLVYGLAGSLTMLFVGRALAGVMGANISVAQAAMADITSQKDRAKAMGMIGAAFGLGFILGPAMGGLLSQYGLATAPLVAAVITGLNGIAALFLLAETRNPEHHNGDQPEPVAYHPLAPSRWKAVAEYGNVLVICLLMGLFIAMFSAFEVVLPLWGNEFMGWTMTDIGWVFVYVGVVAVIVQGGIIRRLTPKIGEKLTTTLGLFLVAVGLMLLAQMGKDWVWLSLAFIAAGSGFVHPGFSSLVSINSDADKQGMMLGLFQSMSALGRGVGPVMGGIVYGSHKGGVLFVAAIGVGVVLLLFLLVGRKIKNACQIETPAVKPTHP
ncbi:MAG: MFS transporter [Magnetococcales bacterium]|nr:MFS transporter [Magnetococcales bacterium]